MHRSASSWLLRGATLRLLKGRGLSSLGRRAVLSTPPQRHVRAFYSPSPTCRTTQEAITHTRQSEWRPETDEGTAVTSVTLDHDARVLQVKWEGGDGDEVFPYVWLRDNCRCPSCYHEGTRSRLLVATDKDLHAQPITTQVSGGGQRVEVVWRDGHRSEYEAEWLHLRGFSEASRQARASRFRLARRYWGSELLDNLPEVSFEEVMQDDAALLAWLQGLEVFGFVKVGGAPAETGQVRRLGERIAFIRKTHYGEEFAVKAKEEPSNLAYVDAALQLHTDLPFYHNDPGVQFIHCIVQYQGEGGDSLIADAAHVARVLQQTCPEHFNALANTLVDWFDIGTDEMGLFHKVLRFPMICLDERGDITRINVNEAVRDSSFSVPVEQVQPWYNAMVAFHTLLNDPKYRFQVKMTPGTILTFDNLRIVHGRTGYESGPGERHVEGCYVDWDEVRSRRRVLEAKLNPGSRLAL